MIDLIPLRASASPRFMKCIEAPYMGAAHPQPDTDPAREGVAAHEMGELILDGTVSSGVELVDRISSNGVMWSAAMVDPVQTYTNYIKNRGVGYWIERNIRIINGRITGRCDTSAYGFNSTNNTLYVDDYKNGFSPVDVFENWQLLIYGMGTADLIDAKIDWITFTIVQPNAYHPDGVIRSWTISYQQLLEYYQLIVEQVARIDSGERVMTTGPWCRYCAGAQGHCAAFKMAGGHALDIAYSSIPDTSTPDEIATLLDNFTRAQDIIKHMVTGLTTRAEGMIQTGQPVKGWAVKPAYGNRIENDADAMVSFCQAMGVDPYAETKQKMATPAELERRGIPSAMMATMTHKPQRPPKLMRDEGGQQADKAFKQ